tara:strand:- start:489 stop:758 length:270 start_codon:yes stop_codon:yes gene_type:complete
MENYKKEINNNKELTDVACKVISEQVMSCLSYLSMCGCKPIKKLSEIDSSLDKNKMIEIFNLSKSLEVLRDNHKAMVRELNEKEEGQES